MKPNTTIEYDGVGDPRFFELLVAMWSLHKKKQNDYGGEGDSYLNYRSAERYGIPPWVSCLSRADEKMGRLANVAKGVELANESAEDSFMDIAVHAIIALILYRETFV